MRGLQRELLINNNFSIHRSITAAAIPEHAHPEYAVSYYFSGEHPCRTRRSGSIDFRAGDLGLLNPEEIHEDVPSSGQRDYMLIKLKPGMILDMLSRLGFKEQRPPVFSTTKASCDERIGRRFEALRTELEEQRFGYEIVVEALVNEICVEVLRRYTSFRSYCRDHTVANWRVRRAIDYVDQHYMTRRDLGELSKVAGLSKYHLIRRFKEATGLTPHSYAMALRIEKAKELLAVDEGSIAEIAQAVGFVDQSHFSSCFKRYTLMSPYAFRQGCQNKV